MVVKFDAKSRRAVHCLYCGTRTVLPAGIEQRLLHQEDFTPSSTVFLVRCRLCFKEAPYGPEELVQDVA